MPAASTAIAPRGGYNHGSIYYLSPQTGSSSVGDINILTAPVSGTAYVLFSGTNQSLSVNTIRNISGTTFLLAANTADGSDNCNFGFGGGGALLTSRGAILSLDGNEHANTGRAVLLAGTGGGLCIIGCGAGAGAIQFYGNGASRATMDPTGIFQLSALTASRGVYTDGSKNLSSTIARTAWTVGDVTGSGSLTVTETVYEADYYYDGPYIGLRISLTATLAGTASTEIRIPHPVPGVADHASTFWDCKIVNDSILENGCWNYNGTNIVVTRNLGNWTAGSSTAKIFIQGRIRAT